jgi:hypothetical protein
LWGYPSVRKLAKVVGETTTVAIQNAEISWSSRGQL